MELHENDVVLTLWGASLPDDMAPPGFGGGDWLCLLVKRAAGGLEGEYRFRYHAGPDFDSDDVVRRYSVVIKEDSPHARSCFVTAIRMMMSSGGFTNVSEKEVNGDVGALKVAMLEMPGWATRIRTEEKR